MARKKTVEECIEDSRSKHGNVLDYTLFKEEGYSSNKVPVTLVCKKHGSFKVTMNDHLGKKLSSCPTCGLSSRTGRTVKRSYTDVIEDCSKVHDNMYKYINDRSLYRTVDTIDIVCPIHGQFSKVLSEHLSGGGCQQCSLSARRLSVDTVSKYVLEATEHFNGKYDYTNTDLNLKSIKQNITYACPVHGLITQSFENHFIQFHSCNRCSKQLSIEDAGAYLKSIDIQGKSFKNAYVVLEDTHSLTPFKDYIVKDIYCEEHTSYYDYACHRLYVNTASLGCPYCSVNTSSYEKEIIDYVKSLGINPIQSYRPSWLNGKELDIYIPSINLGIEFNGTMFHHSSKTSCSTFALSTSKDSNYHYNKWKLCFDNNTTLLSIYDFYWNDPVKKSIYLSKIRHYLGKDEKIYARKCKIVEIDNSTAYTFYDNNHIEGKGFNYKASRSFGMYLDDDLVMCATVGEMYSQSTKKFKTKLHRICTKVDTTVVGGISKLTKFILSVYDNIVYQITLSSGGSTLKYYKDYSIISPRYFWVEPKTMTYHHRNHCQKGLLEKHFGRPVLSTDTENSYMERLGYLKVFDNGLAELSVQ